MSALGLIPWWWKLAGAVLALAALIAAERAYESHLIGKGAAAGYGRAKGEWTAAEARIKAAAELAAGAETKRARAETAALQLQFDQLGDSQQKARIDHEIAKNIAVAAALAGTERLSIPAGAGAGAGSALPKARTVEGAAAGARVAAEARADLLPGVSAVLFRFAGDYGQLVRDYNAVVERYDIARASCNASD